MAEPHVVTALVRKRAELARGIEAAERYLRRLQAHLTHVDAVLRLYQQPDGGAGPDGIPHGLLPRRTRWFQSGELPRCVLGALRTAGPAGLTATEIAARILAAKGLDPDDAECRAVVRRGVTGCLRRRRRGGLIERLGEGAGARWRVAVLATD